MCDNKPSRFNTKILSTTTSITSISTEKYASSVLSTDSIVSKTSKPLSKQLTLIDKFYDINSYH